MHSADCEECSVWGWDGTAASGRSQKFLCILSHSAIGGSSIRLTGNPLRPTRIGVNPDKVWFQGSSRGAETYKATPALRYGSCDRRDETQALAFLAPNVMACMEDLTSHRQVGTNSGRLGVSFGGGVAYRVAILAYCNAS